MQSSITAAKHSFNSKGTIATAAWVSKESNRLEIEGKSEHERTQAKSMAEQKRNKTEHPELHPLGLNPPADAPAAKQE